MQFKASACEVLLLGLETAGNAQDADPVAKYWNQSLLYQLSFDKLYKA